MAAVYAQSDVLVMPSRIEPFGMAPIQAMQYGIVPIVSKIAGVAEVLDDNVDSYILENNLDPKELAELMQKAMRNRNKLEQMSKEGLTKAQKLSWANTVEQTLKAYAIVTNTGANHEQSN
jgi:glycosyltransferase involved in cell wall biosynthesis